jgi:hypothetical protein
MFGVMKYVALVVSLGAEISLTMGVVSGGSVSAAVSTVSWAQAAKLINEAEIKIPKRIDNS